MKTCNLFAVVAIHEKETEPMKTKNKAAQELAKISHMKPPSKARKAAARENGKKGGRPVTWEKAPKRGYKNPKAELYRFTVVRLADKAERFTNRKPAHNDGQMVWDNVKNCDAGPKSKRLVVRSRIMPGQFCTQDDHLRYAIRGKCMKCGQLLR